MRSCQVPHCPLVSPSHCPLRDRVILCERAFNSLLFIASLSGELRDAVKSGHYMTVKLALNSKEEYNLDQEVCSAMFFLNNLKRKSCQTT